jgi:hypothetical protein
MWDILVTFVDANKLGGWVRALVAAGFGVLLGKWPLLGSIFGPDLQTTAGVLFSGIAVGVWSHFAKNKAET